MHPSDQELLHCLIEEAAEVQQAATKALRHGLASRNPMKLAPPDNQEELNREMGDLLGIAHLLGQRGILDRQEIRIARKNKLRNVGQYLHHSIIRAGKLIVRKGRYGHSDS